LEVKLSGRHLNPELQDLNFEIAQYYNTIDVWCVNDEYPARIEVDTRLITFDKPLRFRDFDAYLPEGMWLHRKYDREYNNAIVSMSENWNHILTSYVFPFPDEDEMAAATEGKKKDAEEENIIANTAQQLYNREEEIKKKRVKAEKDMPYTLTSSKKLMQLKGSGSSSQAVKDSLKAKGGDKKDKKKK
jgi:hypothetical protein